MGYMNKSVVMQAIEEDMKESLHVYSDKESKDIVKFCYKSVTREIDKLPQYRIENVEPVEIEMVRHQDNYVPKELCTMNRFGEVDDCKPCNTECYGECNSCKVTKVFNEYAKLTGQYK